MNLSQSGNAQQETHAKTDKMRATIRRIEVPADIRESRNLSRLNSSSRSSMIRHILLSRFGALSKTTSETRT